MEFLDWKIITDTVVCKFSPHYWLIFIVILKVFLPLIFLHGLLACAGRSTSE